MRRGIFGTRLGFYFAAIGSAFGLGSLWRFPYVVAENGGGAFVLLYAITLLMIGLPLLIGELTLGKFTRRSAISASRQLIAHKHNELKSSFLLRLSPVMALMSVIVCVFILAYYSVISGWVLHFFFQFAAAPFHENPSSIAQALTSLKNAGWLQILLMSVHLLLVVLVVVNDVEDGIEKVVGYIIPIFVGIVFVLMLRALQLETMPDGLRLFLYPDFTKLKISSLGAAIGQLCFTLSLGFATMITFGSYLKDDTLVGKTGFRVAGLDSLSALIAGLLIFPLMVGVSGNATVGPDLMFQTIPHFFLQLDSGIVFGFFFFLCLYLAALGASISILETIVANMKDTLWFPRVRATWIAGGVTFLVGLIPALSSSVFKDFRIAGRSVLEFFDWGLINWVVPILALFMSQLVVYKVNANLKRAEFGPDEDVTANILYFQWSIFMRWVVPPVILLGLFLQIIALF